MILMYFLMTKIPIDIHIFHRQLFKLFKMMGEPKSNPGTSIVLNSRYDIGRIGRSGVSSMTRSLLSQTQPESPNVCLHSGVHHQADNSSERYAERLDKLKMLMKSDFDFDSAESKQPRAIQPSKNDYGTFGDSAEQPRAIQPSKDDYGTFGELTESQSSESDDVSERSLLQRLLTQLSGAEDRVSDEDWESDMLLDISDPSSTESDAAVSSDEPATDSVMAIVSALRENCEPQWSSGEVFQDAIVDTEHDAIVSEEETRSHEIESVNAETEIAYPDPVPSGLSFDLSDQDELEDVLVVEEVQDELAVAGEFVFDDLESNSSDTTQAEQESDSSETEQNQTHSSAEPNSDTEPVDEATENISPAGSVNPSDFEKVAVLQGLAHSLLESEGFQDPLANLMYGLVDMLEPFQVSDLQLSDIEQLVQSVRQQQSIREQSRTDLERDSELLRAALEAARKEVDRWGIISFRTRHSAEKFQLASEVLALRQTLQTSEESKKLNTTNSVPLQKYTDALVRLEHSEDLITRERQRTKALEDELRELTSARAVVEARSRRLHVDNNCVRLESDSSWRSQALVRDRATQVGKPKGWPAERELARQTGLLNLHRTELKKTEAMVSDLETALVQQEKEDPRRNELKSWLQSLMQQQTKKESDPDKEIHQLMQEYTALRGVLTL